MFPTSFKYRLLVMRLMQSFFHKAKIWQLIFFVNLNDNQSSYFGYKDGAGSGIPPSLGLIDERKKSNSIEIACINTTLS